MPTWQLWAQQGGDLGKQNDNRRLMLVEFQTTGLLRQTDGFRKTQTHSEPDLWHGFTSSRPSKKKHRDQLRCCFFLMFECASWLFICKVQMPPKLMQQILCSESCHSGKEDARRGKQSWIFQSQESYFLFTKTIKHWGRRENMSVMETMVPPFSTTCFLVPADKKMASASPLARPSVNEDGVGRGMGVSLWVCGKI